MFNPEIHKQLLEIQMHYCKQRLLGVRITPQKDLGCAKLRVIRSAGLDGEGKSEGVFTGQK